MTGRRDRRTRVGVLLAVALGAGCWVPWGRPQKTPGFVFWSPAEPAAEGVAALAAAGAREVFVETAELLWQDGAPVVRWGRPRSMPRSLPVTLVVAGSWTSAEVDPGAAAAILGERLAALRLEAEGWGAVPVGFHLDVAAGGDLAVYADTLRRLRRELDRDLFLSASLERAGLDDPACRELAGAVDFLVAFLYGQRPGERDDPGAWRLAGAERDARRVRELGRDFYVAAVTVGAATQIGPGGEPLATTTRAGLAALATHPALQLASGFSLAAGDRRAYVFTVEAAAQIGELRLRRGETVRAVASADSYLRELVATLARLPEEHRLGVLFYRLPEAGERLASPAASLAALVAGPAAAAPASAPPAQLVAQFELVEGAAHGLRLRAALENRAPESTEISLLDRNYLELEVEGGTFGEVAPGDFQRFALLPRAGEEVTMAGLRAPVRLRLYRAVLEGGERVTSGELEVRGEPARLALRARGRFLLPDGREVEVEPVAWHIPLP